MGGALRSIPDGNSRFPSSGHPSRWMLWGRGQAGKAWVGLSQTQTPQACAPARAPMNALASSCFQVQAKRPGGNTSELGGCGTAQEAQEAGSPHALVLRAGEAAAFAPRHSHLTPHSPNLGTHGPADWGNLVSHHHLK